MLSSERIKFRQSYGLGGTRQVYGPYVMQRYVREERMHSQR